MFEKVILVLWILFVLASMSMPLWLKWFWPDQHERLTAWQARNRRAVRNLGAAVVRNVKGH